MEILWTVSLVIEFCVVFQLARTAWHQIYPRFFAYLIFDWVASFLLFWVAQEYPHAYDASWKVVQLGLFVGRFLSVFEVYGQITKSVSRWRFSDGVGIPIAGLAALIFHLGMVRPLTWPNASLETVFSLVGACNSFLGFFLCWVVAKHAPDRGPGTVEPMAHAMILCGYLLMTAPCYYAASLHRDTIGTALMIVAVVSYSAWLWCIWETSRGLRRAAQ